MLLTKEQKGGEAYKESLSDYLRVYVSELAASLESRKSSVISETEAIILSDIMSDIFTVMGLLYEEGVNFDIEELDVMTRAENLKERLLNNFEEEGEEEV